MQEHIFVKDSVRIDTSLPNEINFKFLTFNVIRFDSKEKWTPEFFLTKAKKKLHFMNAWLAVQIQAVELHLTQWHPAFILVAGRLPEAFPPVYQSFIRSSAENNGIMVIIFIQHITHTSHNHWYKHYFSVLGETGLYFLFCICHSCSKMI